jgi:HSP20 family protein
METLSAVRSQLHRLLDDFAGAAEQSWLGAWAPPADIQVNDGEISIQMELPGVAREDVEVRVAGQVVTIAGERKAETAEGDEPIRAERLTGKFERSFALPWALGAEGVQAKLDKGVLSVTVPRARVTVVTVNAEEG